MNGPALVAQGHEATGALLGDATGQLDQHATGTEVEFTSGYSGGTAVKVGDEGMVLLLFRVQVGVVHVRGGHWWRWTGVATIVAVEVGA